MEERKRALVLGRVVAERLTIPEAALLLGLSERSVWRLKSRFVAADLDPAALAHMLLGIGFDLGAPPVLLYFARHGELPMSPFGWRYMAGPFEHLRPEQFAALGWALVGVCALDVLAGIWLWQGRRPGFRLGMATNGPALLLGIGFELPVLLLGVPIRAALVVAGRHSLR